MFVSYTWMSEANVSSGDCDVKLSDRDYMCSAAIMGGDLMARVARPPFHRCKYDRVC